MTSTESEKIFTKSFVLLFASSLFVSMVMYALVSSMTSYALTIGATVTVAGLISGINMFGGLFSRFYSGNGLERHRWRNFALFFMVIDLIASASYLLTDNLILLVIFRFIQGFAAAASSNALLTIVTAIIPKKHYSEAFGYFMLSTTLAVGLGPFLENAIFNHFNYSGCFIAVCISSVIGIILFLLVDSSEYEIEKPANTNNDEYTGIERFIELSAIPISVFISFLGLGYIALLSFHKLYAVEVNLTGAFSWFFVIYSIVLLMLRPIAGKIQDKGGDKIVCYIGIIAQTIGLFLIVFAPSNITVIICAVCTALGFGTLSSAGTSIITRSIPPNRRSYGLATFFVFCNTTMGFGPALIGSFVTESTGFTLIFLIAAIVSLLALPLCVYALRHVGKASDS